MTDKSGWHSPSATDYWSYKQWVRHSDDRFFQLVKEMAVAMSDRCQEGLMGPDEFGKMVVSAAGGVMLEFLYTSGERQRPLSHEEQERLMAQWREAFKK